MNIICYSTRGPCRDINQDGLFINGAAYVELEEPRALCFPGPKAMIAVVDGMGGMGGGELATEVILKGLNVFLDQTASCHALEIGLLAIQKQVHAAAESHPAMGAAIAGLWLGRDGNVVFNCGDCRVYRCRSGYLEKLTHDHSIVQELADSGQIDEEEMRLHPRKNILTSAISADDADPRVFCEAVPTRAGDQFLLCSDGLWECLSLEEMEECMAQPPQLAASALKNLIQEKMARDNVSFIIANCQEAEQPSGAARKET